MTDISELYHGPLEDFIQRRAELAKQVRAAGDRDGAARIKVLRKPSRAAWALNAATASDHYAQLVGAVNATITAQAEGGDVRSAMTDLRESVRAFATHAADNANAQRQNLDRSTLITAVLAVLGDPHSFQLMQRGELTDVPDAGGLDILANMNAAPMLTVSSPQATSKVSSPASRSTRSSSAREAVERAEAQLVDLRNRTDQALRDLNAAETAVDAAERRRDEAAKAIQLAKAERDSARAQTEEASQRMRDAEDRIAELKRAIDER